MDRCLRTFQDLSLRLIRKGFTDGIFSVTIVVAPSFRIAELRAHPTAEMELVYKRCLSLSLTELMLLVATGIAPEEIEENPGCHGALVRLNAQRSGVAHARLFRAHPFWDQLLGRLSWTHQRRTPLLGAWPRPKNAC